MSSNTAKKRINVKCPQCESKFSYYESEFRPFCSEKCKMIDLGNWFTEDYQFSSPISNEEEFREYEKALLEKGLLSDEEN